MKLKFLEILEYILLTENNKDVLGFIDELAKDDYLIVSKKAVSLLMKYSIKEKKNYTANLLHKLYCKLTSAENEVT